MKPISFRTAAFAAPLTLVGILYGCALDEAPPVTGNGGQSGSGSSAAGTGTVPMGGMSGSANTGTSGSNAGTTPVGTSGSTSVGGGGASSTAGTGSGGTTAGTSSGGTGTGGGGADVCDGTNPTGCIDEVAGKNSDFGYPFKSSYFVTGCAQKSGHDCITVDPCPNQNAANFEDKGAMTLETFPIGGTPGQNYKVTFSFNAVSEAKDYQGGTRDKGNTIPASPDTAVWDTFYRDGNPLVSNYNVLKLTVFGEDMAAKRHYYMNSFPPGNGFESHRTFLISYKKSIVVVGGGKITYLVQDSNCHAIDNCGPGNVSDTSCDNPRSLPNEPTLPLPPMYMDPANKMLKPTQDLSEVNQTATQPWHSQFAHFTITAIEKTNDPVTMNYPDPQ